jgi:SNF2 family DNA or RNA helicase
MVRLLDILQDYMAYRKYKFERIDGLSKAADRQAAIDSYVSPSLLFHLCISFNELI